MLVTVINKTAAELPVTSAIGVLKAGGSRVVDLTTAQMEIANPQLVSLAAAGLITWSVAANTNPADDAAEGVVKEQLEDGSLNLVSANPLKVGSVSIRVGTGSPEGVVVGAVGDLFLRTNGGAGTVLYVKETGTGNTGWIGK